jgi:hypothetical protein
MFKMKISTEEPELQKMNNKIFKNRQIEKKIILDKLVVNLIKFRTKSYLIKEV